MSFLSTYTFFNLHTFIKGYYHVSIYNYKLSLVFQNFIFGSYKKIAVINWQKLFFQLANIELFIVNILKINGRILLCHHHRKYSLLFNFTLTFILKKYVNSVFLGKWSIGCYTTNTFFKHLNLEKITLGKPDFAFFFSNYLSLVSIRELSTNFKIPVFSIIESTYFVNFVQYSLPNLSATSFDFKLYYGFYLLYLLIYNRILINRFDIHFSSNSSNFLKLYMVNEKATSYTDSILNLNCPTELNLKDTCNFLLNRVTTTHIKFPYKKINKAFTISNKNFSAFEKFNILKTFLVTLNIGNSFLTKKEADFSIYNKFILFLMFNKTINNPSNFLRNIANSVSFSRRRAYYNSLNHSVKLFQLFAMVKAMFIFYFTFLIKLQTLLYKQFESFNESRVMINYLKNFIDIRLFKNGTFIEFFESIQLYLFHEKRKILNYYNLVCFSYKNILQYKSESLKLRVIKSFTTNKNFVTYKKISLTGSVLYTRDKSSVVKNFLKFSAKKFFGINKFYVIQLKDDYSRTFTIAHKKKYFSKILLDKKRIVNQKLYQLTKRAFLGRVSLLYFSTSYNSITAELLKYNTLIKKMSKILHLHFLNHSKNYLYFHSCGIHNFSRYIAKRANNFNVFVHDKFINSEFTIESALLNKYLSKNMYFFQYFFGFSHFIYCSAFFSFVFGSTVVNKSKTIYSVKANLTAIYRKFCLKFKITCGSANNKNFAFFYSILKDSVHRDFVKYQVTNESHLQAFIGKIPKFQYTNIMPYKYKNLYAKKISFLDRNNFSSFFFLYLNLQNAGQLKFIKKRWPRKLKFLYKLTNYSLFTKKTIVSDSFDIIMRKFVYLKFLRRVIFNYLNLTVFKITFPIKFVSLIYCAIFVVKIATVKNILYSYVVLFISLISKISSVLVGNLIIQYRYFYNFFYGIRSFFSVIYNRVTSEAINQAKFRSRKSKNRRFSLAKKKKGKKSIYRYKMQRPLFYRNALFKHHYYFYKKYNSENFALIFQQYLLFNNFFYLFKSTVELINKKLNLSKYLAYSKRRFYCLILLLYSIFIKFEYFLSLQKQTFYHFLVGLKHFYNPMQFKLLIFFFFKSSLATNGFIFLNAKFKNINYLNYYSYNTFLGFTLINKKFAKKFIIFTSKESFMDEGVKLNHNVHLQFRFIYLLKCYINLKTYLSIYFYYYSNRVNFYILPFLRVIFFSKQIYINFLRKLRPRLNFVKFILVLKTRLLFNNILLTGQNRYGIRYFFKLIQAKLKLGKRFLKLYYFNTMVSSYFYNITQIYPHFRNITVNQEYKNRLSLQLKLLLKLKKNGKFYVKFISRRSKLVLLFYFRTFFGAHKHEISFNCFIKPYFLVSQLIYLFKTRAFISLSFYFLRTIIFKKYLKIGLNKLKNLSATKIKINNRNVMVFNRCYSHKNYYFAIIKKLQKSIINNKFALIKDGLTEMTSFHWYNFIGKAGSSVPEFWLSNNNRSQSRTIAKFSNFNYFNIMHLYKKYNVINILSLFKGYLNIFNNYLQKLIFIKNTSVPLLNNATEFLPLQRFDYIDHSTYRQKYYRQLFIHSFDIDYSSSLVSFFFKLRKIFASFHAFFNYNSLQLYSHSVFLVNTAGTNNNIFYDACIHFEKTHLNNKRLNKYTNIVLKYIYLNTLFNVYGYKIFYTYLISIHYGANFILSYSSINAYLLLYLKKKRNFQLENYAFMFNLRCKLKSYLFKNGLFIKRNFILKMVNKLYMTFITAKIFFIRSKNPLSSRPVLNLTFSSLSSKLFNKQRNIFKKLLNNCFYLFNSYNFLKIKQLKVNNIYGSFLIFFISVLVKYCKKFQIEFEKIPNDNIYTFSLDTHNFTDSYFSLKKIFLMKYITKNAYKKLLIRYLRKASFNQSFMKALKKIRLISLKNYYGFTLVGKLVTIKYRKNLPSGLVYLSFDNIVKRKKNYSIFNFFEFTYLKYCLNFFKKIVFLTFYSMGTSKYLKFLYGFINKLGYTTFIKFIKNNISKIKKRSKYLRFFFEFCKLSFFKSSDLFLIKNNGYFRHFNQQFKIAGSLRYALRGRKQLAFNRHLSLIGQKKKQVYIKDTFDTTIFHHQYVNRINYRNLINTLQDKLFYKHYHLILVNLVQRNFNKMVTFNNINASFVNLKNFNANYFINYSKLFNLFFSNLRFSRFKLLLANINKFFFMNFVSSNLSFFYLQSKKQYKFITLFYKFIKINRFLHIDKMALDLVVMKGVSFLYFSKFLNRLKNQSFFYKNQLFSKNVVKYFNSVFLELIRSFSFFYNQQYSSRFLFFNRFYKMRKITHFKNNVFRLVNYSTSLTYLKPLHFRFFKNITHFKRLKKIKQFSLIKSNCNQIIRQISDKKNLTFMKKSSYLPKFNKKLNISVKYQSVFINKFKKYMTCFRSVDYFLTVYSINKVLYKFLNYSKYNSNINLYFIVNKFLYGDVYFDYKLQNFTPSYFETFTTHKAYEKLASYDNSILLNDESKIVKMPSRYTQSISHWILILALKKNLNVFGFYKLLNNCFKDNLQVLFQNNYSLYFYVLLLLRLFYVIK